MSRVDAVTLTLLLPVITAVVAAIAMWALRGRRWHMGLALSISLLAGVVAGLELFTGVLS